MCVLGPGEGVIASGYEYLGSVPRSNDDDHDTRVLEIKCYSGLVKFRYCGLKYNKLLLVAMLK